jgi:hypothetical protein
MFLSAVCQLYQNDMFLLAVCQLYQNDICFCLQSVSYIRMIYVFVSSLSAISERYMFLSADCQLYQNDICFCLQTVSYIRMIYVFVCSLSAISEWYVFVCRLSAISEWYIFYCLQSVSYIRTIYVFVCSLSAISERYMFLENIYSQTCIQRSPLGQRKSDSLRQLTADLRSVDPDFQFSSTTICAILLANVIFVGKHGSHFLKLWCFCYNLQLIISLFDNLIAWLVQSWIENISKVNYQ